MVDHTTIMVVDTIMVVITEMVTITTMVKDFIMDTTTMATIDTTMVVDIQPNQVDMDTTVEDIDKNMCRITTILHT